MPPVVERLRKRRDFLGAAKAERAGVATLLLQGRDRHDGGALRLGFTVTKKNGTSVVRNRIRRRLREVARQVMPEAGRPGFDYVLVAREQALKAPFADLVRDLARAVQKLHTPRSQTAKGPTQKGPPHKGPPHKGQMPKGPPHKSHAPKSQAHMTQAYETRAYETQAAPRPASDTTDPLRTSAAADGGPPA